MRQFVEENRIVKFRTVESFATRHHDRIGSGRVISFEPMPTGNSHRGAMLKARPVGHVGINGFAGFDGIEAFAIVSTLFGAHPVTPTSIVSSPASSLRFIVLRVSSSSWRGPTCTRLDACETH